MPLISLVIVLAVVGFLLWLVTTKVPMDGTIKTIIQVVVVVGIILYLLNVFGLLDSMNTIRIGR